jgi:hypothetical protein
MRGAFHGKCVELPGRLADSRRLAIRSVGPVPIWPSLTGNYYSALHPQRDIIHEARQWRQRRRAACGG